MHGYIYPQYCIRCVVMFDINTLINRNIYLHLSSEISLAEIAFDMLYNM